MCSCFGEEVHSDLPQAKLPARSTHSIADVDQVLSRVPPSASKGPIHSQIRLCSTFTHHINTLSPFSYFWYAACGMLWRRALSFLVLSVPLPISCRYSITLFAHSSIVSHAGGVLQRMHSCFYSAKAKSDVTTPDGPSVLGNVTL